MSLDAASIPNHSGALGDAQLTEREHAKWQSFYLDRERRCPFFVSVPDESLAQWVMQGTVLPGRALDVGCGNGRNAIFLAQQGFTVEAVDYSRSALAWARQRVAEAQVAVTLTSSSIFEYHVDPGTYDLVYDSGCFHHIAPHQRERYVSLIGSLLRPGGWFGLTCFNPEGGSGYSDDEVYARGSMGGGLGYSDRRLREIWSRELRVRILRPMHARDSTADTFGRSLLSTLLAQKT